jgi:hypothetical protein
MVYGKQPGGVHLSLPLPDMRALAKSAGAQPSAEIRDAIITVATAGARRSRDGEIDPYRLHAKVQQTYPSVSIGQVASVLLAWLRVPQ